MDRLDTLALFVRSVETGSFSAAAREAGTTQSAVSKRIAALEARLGTGLIRRTTRSLSLTEDGRTYYEDCRRILDAVAQSETRIGRQRTTPAGVVRIASPVSFGRRKIVPRLRRFLEAHPLIQVELLLNDGFIDLVGSGVDVAIRIGALADSTAVARRIGTTRRATVATPDYFDRAGRPAVPADLTRHNCIVYTLLSTVNEWHFQGPDGPIAVKVGGNYRVNSSEAVREGVLAGIGIAVAPLWLLDGEMASGAVESVLHRYAPTDMPIHAVFPAGRLVAPRTRAFVDFIAASFRGDPSTAASETP